MAGNVLEIAAVNSTGCPPEKYGRPTAGYNLQGHHSRNLRLVQGGYRYIPGYFLGGPVDVTVAEIIMTNATGISLVGITEGQIIEKETPVFFHVSVSKYGPLEIDATIQFVFGAPCAFAPTITITGTRLQYAVSAPRPITLDQAMEYAYSESSLGLVFYDTLEFTDASTGSKIQIVQSGEPLETPQGTFIPCRFGCKHPESETGVVGSMQITVDFLPRSAQRWILDTCRARGSVSVIWRQYLGPNMEPDAWYPVPLAITSVEQTHTGVVVTATFPLLTAMKFPRRIMTSEELPGGRY